MIFAASIAEPPPKAMMQSGAKSVMAFVPSLAQPRRRIRRNIVEAGMTDAH